MRHPVPKPMLGMAALMLLAALLAIAVRHFDLQPYVQALAEWVDGLGPWAPIAFVAIDAAIVVLVLPGVLLTFSAGFLFGVVRGTVYVVVGTTIGAAIAFLIARGLLGPKARAFIAKNPKLGLLSNACAGAGWRFVLLTRLIPFFPFKLSNYFFGMAPFSLKTFVSGTAVGIVPYTFTNVYIGSFAANLSDFDRGFAPQTVTQWSVYIFGLVCAVAALTYLSMHAHRALRREIERARGGQ